MLHIFWRWPHESMHCWLCVPVWSAGWLAGWLYKMHRAVHELYKVHTLWKAIERQVKIDAHDFMMLVDCALLLFFHIRYVCSGLVFVFCWCILFDYNSKSVRIFENHDCIVGQSNIECTTYVYICMCPILITLCLACTCQVHVCTSVMPIACIFFRNFSANRLVLCCFCPFFYIAASQHINKHNQHEMH